MSNTASSGFGRKEDLVERVMESIKTLSKKEEEIKVVGGGKIVKKTSNGGGEVLNFKNSTSANTAVVN
jgi:uridylate kinase